MTRPTRKQAHYIVVHDVVPAALRETPFCRASRILHNRNLYNLRKYFFATVFRYETHARGSAVLRPVQSKSSVPVVFVWGQSCVRFTNERSRTRRKSNARSCRAMHVCADRSLAWLAKRFGQSKLLKRWLPSLAARFAPLPMKYPANENHPRSRSSLSSPRSHQNAPRRRPF